MDRFRHPTVGLYSVWFSEMLRQAGLPLRPDFRVGDIGCGLGYHCFHLEQEVAEVYGFDISEETLSWLKRYPRRTMFEYLDICGDEPTYAQHFDRIFSSDVYEHVELPRQMLSNVYHMLSRDGRFIMTFPNHKHHGQNQIESASELETMFREVGFSACHMQVVNGPSMSYARWLGGFQQFRFWTDYLPNTGSREQTADANEFHETAGFHKSQYLEQIPLLSPGLNMLMEIMVRSARSHPIYDAEPAQHGVQEKRILVVAEK